MGAAEKKNTFKQSVSQ